MSAPSAAEPAFLRAPSGLLGVLAAASSGGAPLSQDGPHGAAVCAASGFPGASAAVAASTGAQQSAAPRSARRCGGAIMWAHIIMTDATAAVLLERRHAQEEVSASMTGSDARVQQIRDWLTSELEFRLLRLEPASADASFRRYFRVWRADGVTRVVMDAPPDKEDIGPFLKVAALLETCDVHVPHVHAADRARGLVLLQDRGSDMT